MHIYINIHQLYLITITQPYYSPLSLSLLYADYNCYSHIHTRSSTQDEHNEQNTIKTVHAEKTIQSEVHKAVAIESRN